MKVVQLGSAYNFIRDKIITGAYPPGMPLSSRKLSQSIGVSRTPVRDALRQLEAEGFVTFRPHLGPTVKSIDLKELRALCGLRLALETYAAGLAAQYRTEAELNEIRQALEAMRSTYAKLLKAKNDKEFQELVQEDIRKDVLFHLIIVAASRNDAVRKELLRLHLINRIVSPLFYKVAFPLNASELQRRRISIASHEEIFNAIAAKNPPAAKDAMERQLQASVDFCSELLEISERAKLRTEIELTTIFK